MADDKDRKGKAADFTVETVGKNLQALIDEGYTEDKDSPRSVIMTLYPQIREAMDRLGLSVRQVYRGLKGKMPLPMTEKTFHTYVQQAKAEYERTHAQEEAKPKRGRPPKRIEKLAREMTYMALAHEGIREAAAEAGKADEGAEGATPLSKPRGLPSPSNPEKHEESQSADGAADTEKAQAVRKPEGAGNADAKARFESHEAELDDFIAQQAAKQARKE